MAYTLDGITMYYDNGLEIKQKKEVRLIDANNAISVLKILADKCDNDNVFEQAISVLESVPTIDAVEVVRCKDCTEWQDDWGDGTHFCAMNDRWTKADFYCADGERKEQKDEN